MVAGLWLWFLIQVVFKCWAGPLEMSFVNPSDKPFQRFVVERLYTGRLYVAGVNRLYQLDADLKLQNQLDTGPTLECPNRAGKTDTSGRSCASDKRLVDNYNKALAIYQKQTKLIVCGSAFRGSCRMHNLYNITVTEKPVTESIFSPEPTASSVAFVARGPLAEDALYAATTRDQGEDKRIPAVGTYSLNGANQFRMVHRTITTETGVHFLDRSAPILIEYIYGFASGNFSYFVSHEPAPEGGLRQSKLIRVSQKDKHYYTYTEMVLRCGGDKYPLAVSGYLAKAGFNLARNLSISTEDDVLYVTFANEEGDQTALCVFSVPRIDQRFLENTKLCNQGSVPRGLGHFKIARDCMLTQFKLEEVVILGSDVNHPLGGQLPVEEIPALTQDGMIFTAVAATTTHMYTVVFMGTNDGRLKKAVVESATLAFVYETLDVEPQRTVLPYLQFDMTNQYIYVLTERTVQKLRVQQCLTYERCEQCLRVADPYCGWCSLENRCAVQEACKSHWMPYKDSKCTSIAKVVPDKIQITTTKFLEVTVQNLPAFTGQLSCVFTVGSERLLTGASGPNGGLVSCPTPQTNQLPPLLPGEHALSAALSVQINDGPDFAAVNFTFYDCSTFKTCHQCVTSQFQCDWCAESGQCTANADGHCRGQHVVNGVDSVHQLTLNGPNFCPHIVALDEPTIYIPSGFTSSITVRAVSLLDFQTDFACEFKMGTTTLRRAAKRLGDLIQCEKADFSYFEPVPNMTAELVVTWAAGKALDNVVQNVRVLVYKCERLATNCGLCLHLVAKYGCGWCLDQQRCTINSKCNRTVHGWLHNDDMCPNPKIIDFAPTSGPVEGGTMVNIRGVNLGRNFSEIQTAVRINNVVCAPIAKLYETSSRIVCITGPANHRKAHSGPVVVKIKDAMDYVAISDQSFHYVVPVIHDFKPTRGPQAGGTLLTILGNYLNAGSNISARVGGVPCQVLTAQPNRVTCRTGGSAIAGRSGGIEMHFDRAVKTFADRQFTYEDDPVVTSVQPEKSTVSGGLLVDVRGERFGIVQNMHLYFVHAGQETLANCTIQSNTQAVCRTPSVAILTDDPIYPHADRPLLLEFGFRMDGVQNAHNMSSKSGFKLFAIYPDPEFDFFQPSGSDKYSIKYFKNDYLTINGNNIDLAVSEQDVRIFVGSELCNLTALAGRAVTCRPPDKQPPAMVADLGSSLLGNHLSLPEVMVSIGGNRNYTIGYLSYEDNAGGGGGSFTMETIAIIASVLAFFAIVIMVLLLLYRRKSTKQQRQMKSLKDQIDAIELKVANECKEAFAELQTDITEWTADATATGIPFLPYKAYVMQVLFPNSNLGDLELLGRRAQADKGLRLLNQLFMNKTFLLTFVRVLEANKYFLSKDRVNVGSLLMVILHEKMDYCTDILKKLLTQLIDRTVERRYQPRILFRRSESIAERMLAAWFTFLMYKYLLDCAGQPLFMLYWAVKQQVEKGPQDALTYDARYSLSEEKLIRQSVQFHPLVVYVACSFDSSSNAQVAARVLDCDTITQVKEKCLDAIYRTTPYSRRPTAADLDLEWRTGVSGRLILQDLDVTTKAEPGGWKRLNTLAHYKVPNNALLALVPKQSSMYNLSLLSERSDKSSTFSLKNSPTLGRAFSPFHSGQSKDSESGYKTYHLVKAHDMVGSERVSGKMASEIYLTRLLTTKGTLQKFVEDLFEAIFSITHRGSALPLCIKYMYDFMDDQAAQHGITDPDVVHAWKSNSLPLRFWVNLIKNPQFLFDIPRPAKIEGCLSVVAQTLMDSCSTQDPQLTKDSPSSKLLFARDIHFYREWVERYYCDVQQLSVISDQDMTAFLVEESRQHLSDLDVMAALQQLYRYVDQYKDQLMIALEEEESARQNRLPVKFYQMQKMMEADGVDASGGGKNPLV